MSLFGDLDIASAADDPFKVPPNVYNAVVSEVKVGKTKDETKTGMTINYSIVSDDEHNGKNVREWKQIPTPADPKHPSPDDLRAMSFLKARLLDLGVPESRINQVTPEDLVGKEVTIVVKDGKNDFVNVTKVTLLQNEPVSTSGKGKKFS